MLRLEYSIIGSRENRLKEKYMRKRIENGYVGKITQDEKIQNVEILRRSRRRSMNISDNKDENEKLDRKLSKIICDKTITFS